MINIPLANVWGKGSQKEVFLFKSFDQITSSHTWKQKLFNLSWRKAVKEKSFIVADWLITKNFHVVGSNWIFDQKGLESFVVFLIATVSDVVENSIMDTFPRVETMELWKLKAINDRKNPRSRGGKCLTAPCSLDKCKNNRLLWPKLLRLWRLIES